MIDIIKICFITTVHGSLRAFVTGFAQYLHEQTGWDISFICNYDEEFEKELPDYIHYYPVKMKRGISLGGIRSTLEMKRIFKREKFDIIQYSTPNASLYATLAGKKAGINARLYCQWGIRYMGLGGIMRFVFKKIEKRICDLSTFIECESNGLRNYAISEGLYSDKKSTVIWNGSACGVDLEKFDISNRAEWRNELRKQLGFSDTDVVFIFAGRITADKGVNELLSAFRMAKKEKNDIKLLVLGANERLSSINGELLTYAENCEDIIFTGRKKNIQQYYAAADVFVAPSYREGFGLVVIEAAAMGLPAIVSDVPGQIDAVIEGETGITCKVKNDRSLKDAICYMADKKDEREKMGEAAYKFAKSDFDSKILFGYLADSRKKLSGGEM